MPNSGDKISNVDHLMLDHCTDVVAHDCARLHVGGAVDVVVEAARDVVVHHCLLTVTQSALTKAATALDELNYREECRELGDPERYVRTVVEALFNSRLEVRNG